MNACEKKHNIGEYTDIFLFFIFMDLSMFIYWTISVAIREYEGAYYACPGSSSRST